MIAIEDSPYGDFLDRLGQSLGTPRAVIIFSAHWESAIQAVSEVNAYETIYDFGGFPPELYRISYPARGDLDLSHGIEKLLADAGVPFRAEKDRGLDHGAWTLLKRVYPQADVPVIEMSVNAALAPSQQMAVGRALASLREDVLIVGSGVTVHNFGLLSARGDQQVQQAVRQFEDWLEKQLIEWNVDALLHYEVMAPYAHLAVPPQAREHFAPLFYVLGAVEQPQSVAILHKSWLWQVMANTAYQFS